MFVPDIRRTIALKRKAWRERKIYEVICVFVEGTISSL
jgi:hypothetical protein